MTDILETHATADEGGHALLEKCNAPLGKCNAPSEKCTDARALPEKCTGLPMPATEAERVETGRKLLALKAQLRGTFKAWVGDNCGFGYRAAAAWMREARAAEIDCKLAELRRQAEANPPMLNLVPSEFATKSTLTDAERQTFMDLAIHGSPLAEGLPRFGSVLGHALFEVPHATFDDLKEVAIRAELYLQGAVLELRALSELLHAYPSAGIVSSCQLAKDKE